MQLFFTQTTKIFAQCHLYIFLREQHMYILKVSIVGRHRVILQVLNGVHSLIGHIGLGQHLCEFFGTVVTEVEENHHIALFYLSLNSSVGNGFDKFIGHFFGITLMHCLHHVRCFLAHTTYQQVVSLFHSIPSLVAIHGIKAPYDTGNVCIVRLTNMLQSLNKANSTLRVCVASVHETMHIRIFKTVFFRDDQQLI